MENKIKVSDPELTWIQSEIGEIAITQEGAKNLPAIICVHGIPGSHRDFRYIAPLISEKFQVIRLNMPGMGITPIGANVTVEKWSQIINAAANALSLEQFWLLGHSFGGGPVLYNAGQDNKHRVKGLVLLASVGGSMHKGYGGNSPRFYAFLGFLTSLPILQGVMIKKIQKEYKNRRLRPPANSSAKDFIAHLSLIGSIRFEKIRVFASRINVPTLIAHCDDDHLIEPEITEELTSLIKKSHRLRFETGGHYVQKTRAKEIASAFLEFSSKNQNSMKH